MFQIRLQYVCAFQSAVNPQHILIRSQKLARLLILPRVRHTDKTLKTAPGNADLKQLKPLCHFLGLLCAAFYLKTQQPRISALLPLHQLILRMG